MTAEHETTMGMFLEEAVIQEFRAALRGELLRPSENSYDAARKVFNGMIDKRPALIVRCAGVADVINAVNFARTNELLVAVRCGGHNVAGYAVCDGGIVIDLSQMKGMRVDPSTHMARAEAGLTWGEFNHEAQAFGLAATGGFVSTTGIAGLTLGGGLGWLVRKYGLALDNLLSVDIVTADGQFLTASETENQELFWGVRGGGGNFGIATSFEYRIYPVGEVLAGIVLHPQSNLTEVLQFYRDYIASGVPDELTSGALVFTAPDGVPVVIIYMVYAGPIEEGEQVVKPLREFGPPVADQVRPMPYMEVQTMADELWPHGFQNYWKSNFLEDLSDDAIDTITTYSTTIPSPRTTVIIEHDGGAANYVSKDETAFNHRDESYNLLITSLWADPAESETNIQWTREFWEAMQSFTPGAVYVNYLGAEGEDRIKAAYGANYERLVDLKNKYDPTNLFRLNQNIKPDAVRTM